MQHGKQKGYDRYIKQLTKKRHDGKALGCFDACALGEHNRCLEHIANGIERPGGWRLIKNPDGSVESRTFSTWADADDYLSTHYRAYKSGTPGLPNFFIHNKCGYWLKG